MTQGIDYKKIKNGKCDKVKKKLKNIYSETDAVALVG
jgi:hypothetical protein